MSEFTDGYLAGQGNNNNGYGGWGDGWWILLLLLCGWGNGNNGWAGNGGGNQMLGYELGRVATTNDVASGFSTSEIMSDLNDILLQNSQGFAAVQQTLCQGFNGVNHAISDCCCQTQRAIDNVNYNMAKNTCDIIQSGKDNTQRIIDYLVCKDNQDLRDQNLALRLQASQSAQNAYLISELRPTAKPAYLTCSPFDSMFANGYNFGNGCGCNG